MYDAAHSVLLAYLQANAFDTTAHFYLGELWIARKNWEKAREEFRIVRNLDPGSTSSTGKLAIVASKLYEATRRPEFRTEVVANSRSFLVKPTVDKYLDSGALTSLVKTVSELQYLFLQLTGEWQTSGGQILRVSEYDPTNLVIYDGEKIVPVGKLHKNSNGNWEGPIVLVPGCVTELSLKASADTLSLSGSARMSRKSTKACLSILTKEAQKGIPFPYALSRR